VKDVARSLAADDGSIAAALARGERVTLADAGSGAIVDLSPDDVDLAQETLEGWGVGSEGGLTVALELELTPQLRREGIARELVRVVQDARKAAGLDVSDRIVLGIESDGVVAEALREHRDHVAGETLASETLEGAVPDAIYAQQAEIDGSDVTVTLRKA
jgi:isoleucyl-tRNA synthetase